METLDMKHTGRIIKELREKAGENQEQLAAALQVANRETVARWESGARDLKREHIIALAKHFNVSADYLLGLSDVATVEADVQTACKVTGLSERAIKRLSQLRIANIQNRKGVESLFPLIGIVDYLISEHCFWGFCYNIACTLNYKRLSDINIQTIKERKERYIDEELRINPNYDADKDLHLGDYSLDIENEEEWFEFRKWELFKSMERFTNEVVENYDHFINEEASENGEHNPTP